jgi:TonB family protein
MFFQSVSRILVLALLASTQFCSLESSVAFKNNNVVSQQQNGSASRGAAGCAMEMRTDTEGVDFNSYLRDVYLSVKKRWLTKMPPSIEKGQQGKNTVEFRVLQDGSLPKDSLKMVLSSEKSDFDSASLQGVRDAPPFNHLPASFSKPYIVLRFTFYYNLPIPRNPD